MRLKYSLQLQEAMANSSGDAYLLSTNLPGQNFNPLITKFKDKIIILMVSYIQIMIPLLHL